MNVSHRKQYQRGVGLIEILVALVVIGIGVIAVLGLQGTLMTGSATTKARNEAVSLAREKTEELRNILLRSQFDTELVTPDSTEDIEGVNAQFTRSWTIEDVDSVKDTREIIMQVTWKESDGEDNQIELNTLIAYTSPLVSPLSLEDHSASISGEPDTGYEGLHDETPGDDYRIKEGDTGINYRTESDKEFGIVDILRYSNSAHVQVRVWDANCAEADKIRDADGNPIKSGNEYLCAAFTAFGGTLLRFHGTNYLDLKSTDRKVIPWIRATSPSYCALKPLGTCTDASDFDCLEYQCYASGDCTDTTAGVNGCPTASGAVAALPDLNGGWQGKIGQMFYDGSSPYQAPPDAKACMSKDSEGVDIQTVARSYYSERTTTDGPDDGDEPDKWREGINQSYSCHNALFVDFNESGEVCEDGYRLMIPEGIVWNSFKDDKVIREFDEDDVNDVLGEDRRYCDLVAIYGDIVFGASIDNSMKISDLAVTAEPAAGNEYGECVVLETNQERRYACNFIDSSWAANDPEFSWEGKLVVTGTFPDFTCEGDAAFDKTKGRYEESLTLQCERDTTP